MLKKTRATNPLLKNALRTLCAKSSRAEVFQALPDSATAKVTLYEALDSTTSPKIKKAPNIIRPCDKLSDPQRIQSRLSR